jgi:hypothetical protein
MDRRDRRILLLLVAGIVAVLAVAVANLALQLGPSAPALSYTQLLDAVTRGEVLRVELHGQAVMGQRQDGSLFRSYAPDVSALTQQLRAAGIDITALPAPAPDPSWQQSAIGLVPVFVLAGIMIVFMLRSSGAARRAGSPWRTGRPVHPREPPPLAGGSSQADAPANAANTASRPPPTAPFHLFLMNTDCLPPLCRIVEPFCSSFRGL